MKVDSKGIINGKIEDKYGCKGKQFTSKGISSYSLPFDIIDAPSETISYAVIFDDDDAVPVCGFTWVHWLVANIKRTSIKENESISAKDFVQGVNSWHSCASNCNKEEATIYGGPDPPNGEHVYSLKVFALDKELDLKNGFLLNELKHAMDGHILAHAKIRGTYLPGDHN